MAKENNGMLHMGDLFKRGWSAKLAKKLLPPPTLIGSGKDKTKVWKIEDVENGEQNPLFIQRIQEKQEKLRKKQEEEEKFTEEINIHNPAKDYPNARRINRHFILNIGATNTGKTYTALQALKQAETGVYLAPLRLLAMEIQDTLMDSGVLCSMVTGEEENIVDGATIMSSTVEKIELGKEYEVGIIDECQMISDRDRGGSWTRAILGLCAHTIYLCMSPDAEDICTKLIQMCGDTFEVHYCERRTPLTYSGAVTMHSLQKNDAVILFSRKNVLQFAEDVKKFGLTPSVVYGALPYKARKNQVEMYNSGKTDIIISTDAIGMGMNLPIKRVVFAEIDKFDGEDVRCLLPSEVKQIAGRAGRLGMFDEGFVGVLAMLGNTRVISEGLTRKNNKIQTAYIPFPDEILKNNGANLSEILLKWSFIKYPKIFKQQNLEFTVEKVKFLEKKYKHLDNKTILQLANIMFDEKDENLMLLWQNYVHRYLNNIMIPMPQPMAITLRDYEEKYKELDLYYSFHKAMSLEINIEKLVKTKELVIDKINQLLVETNSKKPQKKHCNHCGRRLPQKFKFTLCDACYKQLTIKKEFLDDKYRYIDDTDGGDL